MSDLANAIMVTFQMMFIFICAFFAIYLIARLLLPVERGLSNYIWNHRDSLKPATKKGSFKEFSQKYRH